MQAALYQGSGKSARMHRLHLSLWLLADIQVPTLMCSLSISFQSILGTPKTCCYNPFAVCMILHVVSFFFFKKLLTDISILHLDICTTASLLIDFLTLLCPMEFSNQFDTIKLGWSIIYFEVSLIKFPKFTEFQDSKIVFILANSADLDEMWHYAAFYLGLQCLTKFPVLKNINYPKQALYESLGF